MSNLGLWRMDRNSPFSLMRNWDSLTRDLGNFLSDYDKSMEEVRAGTQDVMITPACDVHEDAKGFLLSFDLPGFSKEDVGIEVVGRQLTVMGKRSREATTKEAKYHRTEKSYGEFKRVFSLPENAKIDAIEASYENGVLDLVIPKVEIEQPKKVEITEGKGSFLKKLVGVRGDEATRKTANS